LNNASRHANGKEQAITTGFTGDCLEVNIVDAGPGIRAPNSFSEQGGQGLIGLRNRIESLGGNLCISSRPEGGTCLTVQFRLSQARSEIEALHV
jgi:signal transduction histidine kinase